MLGDVGGVASILITLSTFIVNSYSHFNFNLFALSKLYFIKSKRVEIFKNYQNQKDLSKKRKIYISLKDKIILFIYVLIEKITFNLCSFNNN
jgi:hypothetical protein